MDAAFLKSLLPNTKYDTEKLKELLSYERDKITPFLDDLVLWLADMNWPVAAPIAAFLVGSGIEAIPAIRTVLKDSEDTFWQYGVLVTIVEKWSPELVKHLENELEKLAAKDTYSAEEVDIVALGILAKKGLSSKDFMLSTYQKKSSWLKALKDDLDEIRGILNEEK